MGEYIERLVAGEVWWAVWPPPVPGTSAPGVRWMDGGARKGQPTTYTAPLGGSLFVVTDLYGHVYLHTNEGRWRDSNAQEIADTLSSLRDLGLRWRRAEIHTDYDALWILDACEAHDAPVRLWRHPTMQPGRTTAAAPRSPDPPAAPRR